MNSPRHVLVVVGARPQFIKAAALHRAMKVTSGWRATWVHTGQHHDESLSAQFFTELDLPQPHVALQPRSESREWRLGDMMHGVRQAIETHAPHWVLVFGDTDSTLAGAWAAAAEGVPLVHVEAGLRSHLWSMPEEINRIMTDRLSSVLVCPTDAAVLHLRAEGIVDHPTSTPHPTRPRVVRTGDVMHDNAVHFGSSWPAEERGRGHVLLTMHRPSNVDDAERLRNWMTSIGQWSTSHELEVSFPVHPRTKAIFEATWTGWRESLAEMGIHAVQPMGYLTLLKSLCEAPLVLTDSGGVQKEAYSLGTRCVVLRSTTEWVEQVERGQSTLVAHPSEVGEAASRMLNQGRFEPDDLYGSGQSAWDILRCLESLEVPGLSSTQD